MKINNEINFNDVNYDEIEEVEDIILYDSIDGWIDESTYLKIEDEIMTMVESEEDL